MSVTSERLAWNPRRFFSHFNQTNESNEKRLRSDDSIQLAPSTTPTTASSMKTLQTTVTLSSEESPLLYLNSFIHLFIYSFSSIDSECENEGVFESSNNVLIFSQVVY
jgi:hypothetical protein